MKLKYLLILTLAGCISSDVEESAGPSVPSDTTTSGGTVQRYSATIRVRVDTADAAVAATAGVTVGGLTVRLKRSRSTAPAMVSTTDASGVASFSGLLSGSYEVSADRPLTATEVGRLDPSDQEVSMLAAGASVSVASADVQQVVDLVATRRGSLVISEVFIYAASVGGRILNNGHYMEVYNNSDTIIYLDGLLTFRTSTPLHAGFIAQVPCSVNESLRLDPNAMYSGVIHRFPGTGRSYPIQPGESKLIALDATNQSSSGPGLQNLSHASFELIGNSADPNNPFAADMIPLHRYLGAANGEPFTETISIGLARAFATDTSQLDRHHVMTSNGIGFQVFRIPAAEILDVFSPRSVPATEIATGAYQSGWRACEPFINARFDRDPARLADFYVPLAMSRKSLGRTVDGREILQRTRTSSRDFELASPLRRSPPP